MRTRNNLIGLGLAALLVAIAVGLPLRAADEPIDYLSINKIKAEGLADQTSQVMEIASWLTDVHGPRLSGSPNIQKAGEWAVAKMREWGLTSVALEPWADSSAFPAGWSNDKFYLAAVAPQAFPIPGTPRAWTPGTNGLARGPAMLVAETEEADLQKYAGKLKGAFVLPSAPPDVAAFWDPSARRLTREELDRAETPQAPEFGLGAPGGRGGRGAVAGGGRGRGGAAAFNRDDFFRQQGVAVVFTTHARGHGVYSIGGASRTADPATVLPNISIPAEQYGRIARMLAKGIPVTLEADIRNTYHPNPTMFNVVGEIRGTDKADELVMLGAHFDSWHASTGATDNGAGSASMMEAMRILKATGVPLRRTVRIGLWSGEEQGLLGSADYVRKHRAEMDRVSAYLNVDNGSGRLRGIYAQSNPAVLPIFDAILSPFHDLGVVASTIDNTGGTDHLSFDRIANVPAFQFIQDPLEYGTRTHHSQVDTYERLVMDDLRQAATIVAWTVYTIANRDAMMPRKP